MTTANEQMYDAALRHQTYILRYSSGVRNKINDLLDETEDEISGRLQSKFGNSEGVVTPSDWNRLTQLQKVIFQIRGDAWKVAGSLLQDEATALAEQESKFYTYLITSVSPVILDTVTPHPETLKAIVTERPFEGRLLSDWVSKMSEDDVSRLNKTINAGIVQGKTAREVTSQLFGTTQAKGTDGITQMTRGSVNMMVRTAMQHITSSVRREVSLANSEIIEMEEWVATLDGRTCWTEDTLITMADGGKKKISDIRDEDLVLGGLTGKACRVLGVFKSIEPSSVAMYNYANEYIGSTTNGHKILTRYGWRTAKDICLSSELSGQEVIYRDYKECCKEDEGAHQQITQQAELGNKHGDTQLRYTRASDIGCCNVIQRSIQARDDFYKRASNINSRRAEHNKRRVGYYVDTTRDEIGGFKKGNGISSKEQHKGATHGTIEESKRILDRRFDVEHEKNEDGAIQRSGIQGKDYIHKSKAKVSGNNRKESCCIKENLERSILAREDECGEREKTGATKGIKSPVGGEQSKQNVYFNEGEMEGPCLCGKNESQIRNAGGEKEASHEWQEGICGINGRREGKKECCSKEDVDPGEETYPFGNCEKLLEEQESGVFEGVVRAEARKGNVEIFSLSIDDDHTYIAGGMIVHNTPFCKATDGKLFKPGEGPQPPAHIGCRSARVMYLSQDIGVRPSKPVTKRLLVKEYADKNNLGSIDNRDDLPHGTKGSYDDWARKRIRELVGPVPAKTDYNTWLKSQTQEFQMDTLGKTRADLFRKGGLNLDRFIDVDGTQLTLKEVAQRDAAAFERAGLDISKYLN